MANKLIIIIFLFVLTCCGNKQNNGKPYFKLLFINIGTNNHDPITKYYHYLVIENCPENPDSVLVMDLATQYLSSLVNNKPVAALRIFKSDNRFIPNEQSQVWSDVNKDCIVEILYRNGQFENYWFYAKDGENFIETKYWRKDK